MSGYRAILTFKVFAQDSDFTKGNSTKSEELMDEIVKGIKKTKSIGILLKHHYGYNSESVYGCDQILLKHLKDRGLKVELKPVLNYMNGVSPNPCERCSNEITAESSVYYLTDDALDMMRRKLRDKSSAPARHRRKSRKILKENSQENIVFIDGVRVNKSGLWMSQVDEAAENLGNESLPHSEDSVYVRYAAVIKALETE